MKDVLTRWEGVDMTRSKLDLSFACIGFEAEATRAKEKCYQQHLAAGKIVTNGKN